MNEAESHQDIRDAVRQLCSQFPDEYFRKIDAQKGYPEAFVDALIEAGWLAAMIPEEYGGPGLGLTEASVIMDIEELDRKLVASVPFDSLTGLKAFVVANALSELNAPKELISPLVQQLPRLWELFHDFGMPT